MLVARYIRDCVARSDRSLGYPQFFTPDSSQTFPLAPFYKRYLVPSSVLDEFQRDSVFVDFDKSTTEVKCAVSELDRISKIVDKDLSIQFDFYLINYA